MSEIEVVKGQEVEIGEVIGKEGETGWATGPHVHLQINVWGIPVNPRIFLGSDQPSLE
ncbi:MAG: M23 family metallopeptidase [Patescibacteria group bacterium]|nr:M23 family metallopeptidase [Patescibacteria group bacterium]